MRAARITGYEGTIANITERKRAEQAIFAEKERAQVTLQSIGDAVISTDAEAAASSTSTRSPRPSPAGRSARRAASRSARC